MPSAHPEFESLLSQLIALRAQILQESERPLASWLPSVTDKSFVPATENLAHYIAVRHHDLGPIQDALAALGLSSLGRSEARVLTSLDAVLATLERLCEVAPRDYPSAAQFDLGNALLQTMQERIFGKRAGISTRIMVTLPSDAADDPGLVDRLVAAGMDCARINCAHDTPAAWRDMAEHVRSAAKRRGQVCRVLMDIGGPKCRILTVRSTNPGLHVRIGDKISIVATIKNAQEDDAIILTMSFPEILDQLLAGDEVWINDGKIGTKVVECHDGRAELEVFAAKKQGEKLKPEKGLNFPKTELRLPPLTPEDLIALDSVAEIADLVGFSFVQRVEDINLLEAELAKRRGSAPLQPFVLKIETPLAVRNLPQLIVAAGGHRAVAVMIARGDLAVELGFARLSEIQEEILWLCEAAHVPVIWATQVLEGLVSDGLPSRAETTDAAMSQRADCVMLNKGPFLVEAISFLSDVLRRMDRHQHKKTSRLGPLQSWRDPTI